MTENPHFESASSWSEAEMLVAFRPLQPKHTAGFSLQGIRVHVRDHKMRDVRVHDRTLEAHYGGFALSQSRKGVDEARRHALVVPYGFDARETQIAGRAGRVFEAGPEPEPDDIDGRMPAVVVWNDGEMFYFIASYELATDRLIEIAESMHE